MRLLGTPSISKASGSWGLLPLNTVLTFIIDRNPTSDQVKPRPTNYQQLICKTSSSMNFKRLACPVNNWNSELVEIPAAYPSPQLPGRFPPPVQPSYPGYPVAPSLKRAISIATPRNYCTKPLTDIYLTDFNIVTSKPSIDLKYRSITKVSC